MKKLLMLILSLSMATATFTSCALLDELLAPESGVTSESTADVSDSSEEPASDSSEDSASDSIEDEKQEYAVTFQQAGQEDVVVTVTEGDTLAEADIPAPVQEEGYTTVWNAEDLAKLTNISGNVTVVAVKTANSYTITFEAEGVDAPAAQTVTYNSNVEINDLEREGYIFEGWFIKGTTTKVTSGLWTIAENVVLVASWTEMGKATITFVYADGTTDDSTQVYVNTDLTNVPNPQTKAKEGYSIDANWYLDSACTQVASFENITASMTVYAKATANTYTITYNANGGTVASATQEVVYDSNVTLAVPSRDNYTFNNWKDADGNIVTDGKWTLAKDVTLTANWTEMGKATITFVYADGTTDDSTQVYVNTDLTNVPNPQTKAKEGYSIDANWYLDSACTQVASFENITASMTVYAKATANTYTITYNANGGTVASATQEVVYDSNVTLAVPTRDNYTFNNWKDAEGNIVTDGKWTIAKDVTLTANWTEKSKATITFVYADGTTATAQVYVGGSLAAADVLDPTTKAVAGYIVDANWYTDSTYTTVATFENITASTSVYAKKTAKTYTVQLNADGGTGVADSFTVTYGATITLNAPTKVGYTFNGWYNGDKFVAKDEAISWNYDNDSLTLTAKWTAKTYTVTLKTTIGSVSTTTMVMTYGEAYELPTLTDNEASFIGWKLNGTLIPTSGVWTYADSEEVELVAEWKEDSWTQNY